MIEAIFDRDLLNLGVKKSVQENKDAFFKDDEKTFFDSLSHLLGASTTSSSLSAAKSDKIYENFV